MIKNYINTKKVIVFDWDGTIFDSMAGKVKSFSSVLTIYFSEKGRAISSDFVADIYLRNSGKPRAKIFLEVAKQANLRLELSDIEEMSRRLFLLNRTTLAKEKIFPDALRLLNTLASSDRMLFISSSVPQAELDYFVKYALPKDLFSRFSGVFGSSEFCSKGPGHIARITKDSGRSTDKILVIGDDEADFILSKQAGVDCVLVDRKCRFVGRFSQNLVKDLDELCNILN